MWKLKIVLASRSLIWSWSSSMRVWCCSFPSLLSAARVCNRVVYCISVLTVLSIFNQVYDQHKGLSLNGPKEIISGRLPENVLPFELHSAVNRDVARQLGAQQRVLCWILTGPVHHANKAKAVKDTWGRRCNILIFISSELDDSLPTVKLPVVEGRQALWGKTKEALRYVWQNYKDQADWFLKADGDSYVVMENLRYVLSAYNTTEPLFIGHRAKRRYGDYYMQGGAGYVISKEALKWFIEKGVGDPKMCRQDSGGNEDVELTLCLQKLGVRGVDTRDAYGRQRFLPANPWEYINKAPKTKNGFWVWTNHYYAMTKGMNCCSDTVVSFHYVSPRAMHFFDFLIYHVWPFGIVNDRHVQQKYPALPPDANFTAKRDPGPTREDEKKHKEYKAEKKLLDKKIAQLRKEAELLDKDQDLRFKEIAKRKATAAPWESISLDKVPT